MLWFAWKFVPLWYQQQRIIKTINAPPSCDLLENSYLCGISNNKYWRICPPGHVVICLKIRTFVVSATTLSWLMEGVFELWFAWKFVPLWYQQQHENTLVRMYIVVICLKIRTFVVSATTHPFSKFFLYLLWFAWKFVPLWYQQQHFALVHNQSNRCDLLENSYLCGISNNKRVGESNFAVVVICLKIRTFVVSATTGASTGVVIPVLWFAWKFVPLWYQQQLQSYQ